jgi:hypothetical protein
MVDNHNIPFKYFSLQGKHVKCTVKHIKNELYVAKEKILSVRKVVPTLTSSKRQGLSLYGRC